MRIFIIFCLVLVATKFGTSLAHVAEMPGKLRLDETAYKAVQGIYYPGFTIVGLVGELGGMLALAVLLYLTPTDTARFWWTGAALAGLVLGHAVYWLVTHPVNKFWVEDIARTGPGARFFSLLGRQRTADWRELRNIWELSHAIIFCLVTISLVAMAMATSLFEGDT